MVGVILTGEIYMLPYLMRPGLLPYTIGRATLMALQSEYTRVDRQVTKLRAIRKARIDVRAMLERVTF